MNFRLPTFIFTLVVLLQSHAVAQNGPRQLDKVYSFIDSTGNLTIEDIIAPERQSQFRDSREMAADYSTWFRIEIPAEVPAGQYCIDFIIFDRMELYYLSATSQGTVINRSLAGSYVVPSERSMPGHPRVACFSVGHENRFVYVKVPRMQISGRQLPELQLEDKAVVAKQVDFVTDISYAISGGMWIIIISALVLFYYVRDRAFVLFGMYLVCFYLMINKSFLTTLLGDRFPGILINSFVNQVLFTLGPLSFIVFAYVYFNVAKLSKPWRWTYFFIIGFTLVCILASTSSPHTISSYLILFYNLIVLIVATVTAGRSYVVSRWKPAGYFLAGISVPLLVALLIVAHNLDLIIIHNLQIISNLSMLIFCFILGIGVVQRYLESASEKRRHEREAELLRLKARDLGELNETKDKLLSVLSHDLRGPVGNLSAILSLLSERVMTQEEFHDVSNKLRTDVESTYSMLEEVLHWVKSQREGIVAQPVKFDLNKLVDEIIATASAQAKPKGIHIVVTGSKGVEAFADKYHISIVLRNLLSNAIKFSPDNSEITIEVNHAPEIAQVIVIDKGEGMDQKEVTKILNREKVIGAKGTRGEKGTGLGLHLCQEFIAYNNGKFILESVKGGGTTAGFIIRKG